MTPEQTDRPGSPDLDRLIADAERALADAPDDATRRSRALAVAQQRTRRYVGSAGPDEDRKRAEELCHELLGGAEPAAGEERQAVLAVQVGLAMTDLFPRHLAPPMGGELSQEQMLGLLPSLLPWAEQVDPVAQLRAFENLQNLMAQLDPHLLPPELQQVRATVNGFLGPVITESAQEDWSGDLSPQSLALMSETLENAPAGSLGLELMGPLLAYLEPADPRRPGERAAKLRACLEGLDGEAVLAPVLRRELATELLAGAQTDTAALREAADLLEQARAEAVADHPMQGTIVRSLAGAMISMAALEPTPEQLAKAEGVARDVLDRAAAGDAERGGDLFLQGMVGVLRSHLDPDHDPGPALQDLVAAAELIDPGHERYPFVMGVLGTALADRHVMAGVLSDAASARQILGRASGLLPAEGVDEAVLAGFTAVNLVNIAVRLDDPDAARVAADHLRSAVGRLPEHHLSRPNFELVLAVADIKAAGVGDPQALAAGLTEVRRALAHPGLLAIPPSVAEGLSGAMDVLDGLLGEQVAGVLDGLDRMETALSEPATYPEQRIGQLALLGQGYLIAVATGRQPASRAQRAVEVLGEARRLLAERGWVGATTADVLRDLATACELAGAREQAREYAFEGLTARAGGVLLQSGVGDGVLTARGAAAESLRLARWCLADGDPARAVAAIELGRGLALHAATSGLEVPQLLEEESRPELAAAWRKQATDPASHVPGLLELARTGTADQAGGAVVDLAAAAEGLRLQVLAALRSTPAASRLFTAPEPAAIGSAVAAAGADLLVYLIPGDQREPGHLLLVDRRGTATAVPSPDLRLDPDGPADAFLRTSPRSADWQAAFSAVSDWAGAVLVEPLLAALVAVPRPDPSAVPRVVLVPGGRLGAVPWAAARRPDGPGQGRYACEDLVVSTTSSARQLIDVTSRDPLPLAMDPVLVADPTGDLDDSVVEVLALAAAFYPHAELLGDPAGIGPAAPDEDVDLRFGRATPAAVLDQLPGTDAVGASLVHLSCHAVTGEGAETSWLTLTEPLSIAAVVRRAAGRPVSAAGGQVVLSACESDLAGHDHDEALTLATAFLAAGATTVVGSRWKVPDQLTCLLMFAYHHFLAGQGLPPVDALRAAQLWMLAPDRPDLPGMPELLHGYLAAGSADDPVCWAAFGHHGR